MTITVPADVVEGGNQASSKTVTVTIDLPPTVTLTPPETIQNAAFDVTITFNESVTGLERERHRTHRSISHGLQSGNDGDGAQEYTVTITPERR